MPKHGFATKAGAETPTVLGGPSMSDNDANDSEDYGCVDSPWRDGERLRKLWVQDNLSKAKIADRWGCSEATVYRWLKKALSGTRHGHDCPKCGETFPTGRGKRQHYGQSHEGTIAGHTVVCETCGDGFEVPASRLDTAKYCSKECHHGKRLAVECVNCGDSLQRPRWQVQAYEHQFCDQSCHNEWKAESGPVGKNHPAWKQRVERECEFCEETITRRPSHPSVNRWFCDESCYSAHLRETGELRGENHPRYSGGHVRYGAGFTEATKERVRDRDGRRCQACGCTEQTHLEKYDCRLPVHHIQKARSLQDAPAEVRNGEDNLVTLCRECHKKWEGIPLRPKLAD